jgi:hypothetical protein
MDSFLPNSIDRHLRKHPMLASICLLIVALVACWVMIGAGHDLLVYEGF